MSLTCGHGARIPDRRAPAGSQPVPHHHGSRRWILSEAQARVRPRGAGWRVVARPTSRGWAAGENVDHLVAAGLEQGAHRLLLLAVSGERRRAAASVEACTTTGAAMAGSKRGCMPHAVQCRMRSRPRRRARAAAAGGGDVTVVKGVFDLEEAGGIADGDAVPENSPEAFDEAGQELHRVGDGLLADLLPSSRSSDSVLALSDRWCIMVHHGAPR